MEIVALVPGQTAPVAQPDPAQWRRLKAEEMSLAALVHHAGSVAHEAPLEQVMKVFSERGVEFLALVRDGMVTGLCSRTRLGNLLGSRFGFALYSRSAAHQAQVDRPCVFSVGTPVREVLDRALARQGDEFREDVALIDERHALVGLIPIDALARLQTRLVNDQMEELQRQHHELLAAHQALRQSQGRYAGLFDSHVLGVALLDVQGTIQTHNRRLVQLLQPSETVELTSLSPWLPDPERTMFLEILAEQARGGAPVTRDVTLFHPTSGARQFRCSFGWIEETAQVCVCLDDITEQRAIERQLARQEKQTLLDTLVGGIAHELNNKLTPVQGFAELIGMTADEGTRIYTETIKKSVGEAARIIRQLLQLSRPATTEMQPTELKAVVDEALGMMRFQVHESCCRVRTAYSPEPIWVQADPAEIKQVIMNLVLNALQAMEGNAGAMLDIEVREKGARATITVQDNGVGIAPENLERIFDPFFTTKGPERGTGLGLSVCYSIIRQHGGEILVASKPGEGARFSIVLPRETALTHLAPPPWEPQKVDQICDTEGARVLVVEDEPQIRRLIRDALSTKYGCEVDIATNGIDALERVSSTHYRLVLSDVRMAGMNGTELYLWMRESQPEMARRFVFVTGFPGECHLAAEIAQWQVPVLSKPFSLARLAEVCGPFLEAPVEQAQSA